MASITLGYKKTVCPGCTYSKIKKHSNYTYYECKAKNAKLRKGVCTELKKRG